MDKIEEKLQIEINDDLLQHCKRVDATNIILYQETEELIKENEELKQYKILCEQKTIDIFDLIKENEELKKQIEFNIKLADDRGQCMQRHWQKLEKIKEEVKKIGACDHCGWEECNKGCASYILLQIIESEE